jgi:low affinity Fe/Cu permease
MNWFIIIAISMAAIALIVFLIRRNMKDEEQLEEKLKQDYHKPRESDVNDPNVV